MLVEEGRGSAWYGPGVRERAASRRWKGNWHMNLFAERGKGRVVENAVMVWYGVTRRPISPESEAPRPRSLRNILEEPCRNPPRCSLERAPSGLRGGV